jgi:hypothetical protein
MKIRLIVVGLLCSSLGMAQLNEDITDTRNKREGYARLPKAGIRQELAGFTMSGIEESVGKLPLDKMPYTAQGPNFMRFENEVAFDASKYKLEYDEKYLVKINKKTYYGGYPNVPKTKLSSVSFIIGKDTVAIPPAAYGDLYNLNLTYRDKGGKERSLNSVYFSKDKRTVYLYLYSKDTTYANASYEVTFVIQDKKYLRRILDYDIE